MAKWFDLNDASGAKLKLARINGLPHLFVMGLPYIHPKTRLCTQLLGFNTVPSKRYLVRQAQAGEKITVAELRKVFPNAVVADMEPGDYVITQSAPAKPGVASGPVVGNDQADVDMRSVKRLGRNEAGFPVYESPSGRFYIDGNERRQMETAEQPQDFLRLVAPGGRMPEGNELHRMLLGMAGGFVRSMDAGEVQHSEDFATWRDAIFGGAIEAIDSPQGKDDYVINVNSMLFAAVDAAMIHHVGISHDVASDAYGPMARLYDYLPPFVGKAKGLASIPQPLNVAAQRLLGDTTGKTVLYPQAYDGASFAFLPEGTHIRACQSGSQFEVFRSQREDVDWVDAYSPITESGADALFFNMDPQLNRDEYRIALQALRSLAVGARAVFVLASDDERSPGKVGNLTARFLETLGRNHTVDDVFETAPILSRKSGATRGLRTFVVRNVLADESIVKDQQERIAGWIERGFKVIPSWDALKSHIDELIVSVDLKEAQTQTAQMERALANESYQRPYVAFSKLGEARTMSPANLQASSQAYLTRLEQVYGPVDEFVGAELGMGMNTLAARFSPEQIDAIAVMISRYAVGRSSILADDTGIGKGRSLAAVCTWANKRGYEVVFVTDRSNLFSDLARDLNDIGEWDRFRPLVLNADGEITIDGAPGGEPRVLAKGTAPDVMQDILERGTNLVQTQANICFLTYSQISGKDSPKALWVKNQLANALVIFDEAHIAAGSDSNVATQVSEMTMLAKHVQFSSATWAKTPENLHIYQRALPSSVAIGTLTETMRKGGDSFAEIFSTMLSAEGALIRREHDLSKLELEMAIDVANRPHNEFVSDKVADVLGAAAFVSGEMQQVFIRTNSDSVKRLKAAREVRAASVSAKLFSASFGGGSVIYQVMKAVQGSLNAPHSARLAVESLKKGNKPVIVTDATGESIVNQMVDEMLAERERALADGSLPADQTDRLALEVRIPTLRDMLRLVVIKRLTMIKVEVVTPDDVADDLPGERGTNAVNEVAGAELLEPDDAPRGAANADGMDATVVQPEANVGINLDAALAGDDLSDEDGPVTKGIKRKRRVYEEISILDNTDIPADARAVYERGLKEMLEKIEAVPDLPIVGFDVMAHELRKHGFRVGEISGRKNSLIPIDEKPGFALLMPRARSKRALKATIRGFNAGSIDAVIMNRAAAAGVSMHASPRFADQSRRHLIEHQIPENPVDRIQLLGRVNRFDQCSSPLITTASTGIYGEVRYLMMQNRKLARMSANVRSSRDNAMSLKGVTDLFNGVGRSAVKGFLLDNPLISRRLGLTDEEIDVNPDLVNKLTMRIPLLTVAQQQTVYSDVYARFDEIVMRAEMDGLNPLRPHDMNVRAKAESEVVFFGDDSVDDGSMASAFDAPVKVRQIAWTQTLNPLRYDAVLEAAKASVARLLDQGYLRMTTKRNVVTGLDESVPLVNEETVSKIVEAYRGLTRLAHLTTGEDSYNASMITHSPARRAYLKYTWFRDNLKMLMPGSKLGMKLEDDEGHASLFTTTVVTDVKVPAPADWMDLGKWRITMVATGDERARTYTLRSLLSSMTGTVREGGVTEDLVVDRFGPYFAPCLFGVKQETLLNQFDFAPSGRITRKASLLTGNMYLAAEWAAAVGKGTAVSYTDDSGQRHRVIKLPEEFDAINPEFLPVRVARRDVVGTFLLEHLAPQVALPTVVLDTTFKSAMASQLPGGKVDARMVVHPNKAIAFSCSPKDGRRISAALNAGQKGIRHASLGASAKAKDDPDHVRVTFCQTKKQIQALPVEIGVPLGGLTTGGGGGGLGVGGEVAKESRVAVILLSVTTPGQAQRAVQLIRDCSGVELYVTGSALKARAREMIKDAMRASRQAVQAMQDQQRMQIEQQRLTEPGEAVAAPVEPSDEDAQDHEHVCQAVPVAS